MVHEGVAAQGRVCPVVFRKPVVGIISTGSELVDMPCQASGDCNAAGFESICLKSSEASGQLAANDGSAWKCADAFRFPDMNDAGTRKTSGFPGQAISENNGEMYISNSLPKGRILNSNRYILSAALMKDGCIPVYLGTAADDAGQISDLIIKGMRGALQENLPEGSGTMSVNAAAADSAHDCAAYNDNASCGNASCNNGSCGNGSCDNASYGNGSCDNASYVNGFACDMILLTGGVSAGDYDLTPDAMEQAGCEILVKGVKLKPGMACCYGRREGKLVCALSGNPASALTNYYAVVRPAVRKMTGLADYMPPEFTVALAQNFNKKSKVPRILKGKLEISGQGTALLHIPSGQGNTMISSSIGCDCLAEIPAGSGPVRAGAKLEAFTV